MAKDIYFTHLHLKGSDQSLEVVDGFDCVTTALFPLEDTHVEGL
jgi:hypothetical protein